MLLCLSIVSCKKITDVSPLELCIEVFDEKGNNLMDPLFDGNWAITGFTVDYLGESYNVKITPVKTYLPTFYGVEIRDYRSYDIGKWIVYFGELDGDSKQNATLVFHWPDASIDRVTIDYNKRSTSIKLNGKNVDILNKRWNSFRIIK